MMVPAAWIAACEARGGKLPAGLFSDPLDAKLDAIFASSPADTDRAARVFDAAGFATGLPEQETLIGRASTHLAILRAEGATVRLYGL